MIAREFPKRDDRKPFNKAQKLAILRKHISGKVALCGGPCNAPLATLADNDWTALRSIEFDHEIALSNGGEHSVENGVALCRKCHSQKTRLEDTPRAAKIKRQALTTGQQQRRMANKGQKLQGRGFQKW